MDIFTLIIRKIRKIITGAPYRYDYFGDHLAVRKKVIPFLNDEKFNSALNRADKHLYSAKANGRNCFVTDKEFIPNIVS